MITKNDPIGSADTGKEPKGTKAVITNFYISDEADAVGFIQVDMYLIGDRTREVYMELLKRIERAGELL